VTVATTVVGEAVCRPKICLQDCALAIIPQPSVLHSSDSSTPRNSADADDGQHYIDYLGKGPPGDAPALFVEYFSGHQAHLVAELAKANCSARVMEKLQWSTDYHNATVARFSEVLEKDHGVDPQSLTL